MCILSAEEFNKHSSVWMRVLKAAPLSRYKESFVPQINTSNVPFCCIKVWKVMGSVPIGMAKGTGGHGDMGTWATRLLQVSACCKPVCLTLWNGILAEWDGHSHFSSWLEHTPTKRLFSTSNHFIRSLSGQLRAGSLAARALCVLCPVGSLLSGLCHRVRTPLFPPAGDLCPFSWVTRVWREWHSQHISCKLCL